MIGHDDKPVELCRMFVSESGERLKNTRAYEVMNQTLASVADTYRKPYTYNPAIWAEEKSANPWYILLFILVSLILTILDAMVGYF